MKQTTDDRRQTMSRQLCFLFSVVCCLSFVPLSVDAYVFSRDLKLGDTGEDVRMLQMSLNADSQTRVADSGPGSSGSETVFFGDKTQAAVIRYQRLHTDEILRPLGLASGTGYVGAATRRLLGGAVAADEIGTTSLDAAIKGFDAAIQGSSVEMNRSPVDDPRIPDTQEELVAAVDDFAGSDATDEEVRDFSAQMILMRYGYATSMVNAPDGEDNGNGASGRNDESGREDTESSDTGAGCIGLLLDLLGL